MSRIPLLPADVEEPREVVEAIRKRRGGPLLAIDRLVLHSPALAAGWTAHNGAMRTQLVLPRRLHELVTLAVTALMGNAYEVRTHRPQFLAAGGTTEQFEALSDLESAMRNEQLFDEVERAALTLSFEMTRNVKVTDETFARAQAAMGDTRSLVELVGVIATYNMANRVQVAFEFDPAP